MKFYSTNDNEHQADLETAIINGLAPDGGLYMPKSIPQLPSNLFNQDQNYSFLEVATAVGQQWFGHEIPKDKLEQMISDAYNFDIPLVEIEDGVYSLELFHGSTLAFKDVAAQFMAQLMSYFAQKRGEKINILVATSGDTGGAIGHGFLGVEGIDVVILYPNGQVSKLQEQQLTTLGGNVKSYAVDGDFDDCQSMVKEAFVDSDLDDINLASANSINIARLLPQVFYHAYIYTQIQPDVVSIPSGNFGNLTAGLFAERMGTPVPKFIAATNQNDTVPRYLETGEYEPQKSVRTIANSMDVGDPSNFDRLEELLANAHKMSSIVEGLSYDDQQAKQAIERVYEQNDYLMDPHTSMGYLGLEEYQKQYPKQDQGVVISTAHPAKFREIIEPIIDEGMDLPERISDLMSKESNYTTMKNDYQTFKELLRDKS